MTRRDNKTDKVKISCVPDSVLQEKWVRKRKNQLNSVGIGSLPYTHPKYFKGECLLTRTVGHETGIGLETLIEKCLLEGILSSPYTDEEWLFGLLDPKVPICFIRHDCSSEFVGTQLIEPNLLVVHPTFESRGLMHAKFMLMVYPEFLRMVVGSANLEPNNWNEMENMIYVQDFPRKSSPRKPETKLSKDWRCFLGHLGVPYAVAKVVDDFDFSSGKVELVFSIPGHYTDQARCLNMLGSKVRGLLPDPHEIIKGSLSYQTPALGEINEALIRDIWSQVYPSLKAQERPDVKVIFPSTKTVLDSLQGPTKIGEISFYCKSFSEPHFPRWAFHDSISLRKGSLSSSKIMIGTAHTSEKEVDWFYCGSHNFSAAAWGLALTSKQTGYAYHNTNNYELGVVGLRLDVSFDLPLQFPPPAYQKGDTPFDPIKHGKDST